ncbi:MAG: Fe-S cluster assembly protein SufD [Luteimonas sp.]
MTALLDSLARNAVASATPRAALDAIVRVGLPSPRSEAWKYTSLRALERRTFTPTESIDVDFDAARLAEIPTPRLVFVNGNSSAAHSDLAGLPACARFSAVHIDAPSTNDVTERAENVFAQLNAALAKTGALLQVAAGTRIETPIHIVCIGVPAATDQAWHLAHCIEIGADAHATIVEHQWAAAPHAHFANSSMRVVLRPGARLTHIRVQEDAATATAMLRTDAVLDEDAEYRRLDLELGAGLSRHEFNVRLRGERARLIANGVLAANGRRHLDTRLAIEHIARDTTCELLWRGVADGRGRAIFHGGITIHAGADGSDAELSNKNLLLSADAEIDTQPVLVIHADEVKAAHGATVGQLDPTAMFYLRSRGLPAADAMRLLTAAFVREPLGVVESAPLRALLESTLETALGDWLPA